MLEIINLSKAYKANQVLKDTNITVNDGEMVALLGPSGSGKTTILRIVAGFIEANGGDVRIDGESILNYEAHKRNIGVVFQNYALFPHMTVQQNVEFGLKMHKVPAAERKVRVEEALKVVDMLDYAGRYPNQLSGGQQQRVAIARVVAIRAKLMLLDEPLSNLDAKLRRQVRVEIKELQRKLGITTVIVTHDQEEAMAIADKIAILDNGRIQQYDTPEHLYHYPANLFVAKFMGNPPMNFVDARLDASGTCVCGDGFELALEAKDRAGGRKYAGRDVKIGVRSHLMSVETERRPQSMQMKLQIVENLGKELLVSGMVGNSFVRVTVPEDHERFVAYKRLAAGRNPYVWLQITGIYNIFETESGVNIGLEQ